MLFSSFPSHPFFKKRIQLIDDMPIYSQNFGTPRSNSALFASLFTSPPKQHIKPKN
jgi:hypothetical protein